MLRERYQKACGSGEAQHDDLRGPSGLRRIKHHLTAAVLLAMAMSVVHPAVGQPLLELTPEGRLVKETREALEEVRRRELEEEQKRLEAELEELRQSATNSKRERIEFNQALNVAELCVLDAKSKEETEECWTDMQEEVRKIQKKYQ